MNEPLFPLKPVGKASTGDVQILVLHRENGIWLFDDEVNGLHREPFVGDVNLMIDDLTKGIPNAANGFRLHFSTSPFERFIDNDMTLAWLRADPVEGNWYRSESGMEGWLCPSLFFYFPTPPTMLYVRAVPI